MRQLTVVVKMVLVACLAFVGIGGAQTPQVVQPQAIQAWAVPCYASPDAYGNWSPWPQFNNFCQQYQVVPNQGPQNDPTESKQSA